MYARAAAVFLSLGFSSLVDAAGDQPPPYQGALGTYGIPDDSRSARMGESTGLELVWGIPRADSRWGYELNAFAAILETGTNGGTDFYRWGLGGDIRYDFAPRWRLIPFALAGLNLAYNDVQPDDRDDWGWGANLGAGAVSQAIFGERFRLRGELRGIYDAYDDGFTDYLVGFGVEFALAKPTVVTNTVIERVEVVPLAACAAPAAEAIVDSKGCAVEEVTRLDGVTFEFDQARLRPDARTILAEVADTLKRYPQLEVEIAGHTDNFGSEDYNQRLSQQRAEAVRDALVALGIDAARIAAAGYGESQPVADNESDDGREYNRRVEMRIKNLPAQSRLPR